jgi:prepilin-type N-terminal cleavage/methylation domain-containing protein
MTNGSGGFTMVELMVAISIFAIAAAIVIPSMLTYRSNAKLRDAAFTLVANLQQAKQRAIRDRASIAVNFSAADYTIASLGTTDLPAGVSVALGSSVLNGGGTGFNSRGMRSDTAIINHRIVIENNSGEQRIVEINRLGLIDIQS